MRRGALAALLAAAALAHAADAVRPRVGLVLGGGGARGGAHLGVLEALEELRVPVDCIAGTSMGALMAGAYASGVTPAEMRAAISRTDWTAIFDDSAGRERQPSRRRELDERFFPGLEVGVSGGGLRYREGAVAGEKVKLFFNELVHADRGERSIEDLAVPTTLIATDIVTGERVAMRHGNLTSAMRASMSVPGAMAPVVREGRKLVDGGLVDNVPVQEVRDRCDAQVVIAVNVASPLLKETEVSGAFSVVAQMVNLLTEQNVAKSLSTLTVIDVYLEPDLGDITAGNFERQVEAAGRGREAAMAAAPRLRELSVSPEAWRAWRRRLEGGRPSERPVVDEVVVDATRFVSPEHLRSGIAQRAGEPLDAKRLARDLVDTYSRGDLQSLDYELLRERDRTILRLVPIEKSWGPDYLRLGLKLESDMRAESSFDVRAMYRKTWINRLGGEVLAIAQVGSEPTLFVEFYQPLDDAQRFFVRPFAGRDVAKAPLYFDGARLAIYRIATTTFGLDLGVNLGTLGEARVGWREQRESARLDTGSPVLPNASGRVGAMTGLLRIDQLDEPYFPTRGYAGEVNGFRAMRTTADDPEYGKVEATMSGALSWGSLAIIGSLSGGRPVSGTPPIGGLFSLGGPLRLTAFAPGQILAREYALGTLRAEYRLNKPLPLLGLTGIVGVMAERARVKDSLTEPNLRTPVDSFGLYIASATTFGPIYFGYADTRDRPGRWFLFIGTP